MIKRFVFGLLLLAAVPLFAVGSETIAFSFLPSAIDYAVSGSEMIEADQNAEAAFLPALVSSSSLSLEGLLSGNVLRMGKNTASMLFLCSKLQSMELKKASGWLRFSPSLANDGIFTLLVEYDDVKGLWDDGTESAIDGSVSIMLKAHDDSLLISVEIHDMKIDGDSSFSNSSASLSATLIEQEYREFLSANDLDRTVLRAGSAYFLSFFAPFKKIDMLSYLAELDALSALDIISIVLFSSVDTFPASSLSLELSIDGNRAHADTDKALSIVISLLSLLS